jgi:oxalate decarboxylase/phosphoglucose isomerase-like protein (cupin superfamily)
MFERAYILLAITPNRYIIEGESRMTIFAAESNAKTFNYQAGDISQ